MNRISEYKRATRLIHSIISNLSLDLTGICILTETASGPFVLTPILAAVAGADKVIAVSQNSRYGTVEQVKRYTEEWASEFGVLDKIRISSQRPVVFAPEVDLVTNLGFVRPIDESFIAQLSRQSAISLMWEPWEYRKEDLDLEACRKYGIPLLGTNENDSRLQIFRYVGILGLKLLFEAKIEVFNSSVLLVASGVFGGELHYVLESNGANVTLLDISQAHSKAFVSERVISNMDAILVAEHHCSSPVIGPETGITLKLLEKYDIPIIHICGNVNDNDLEKFDIKKIPDRKVSTGYMTVTTADLGIRPIIDLHGAGLKVGESLVRGMRAYGNCQQAIDYALKNSPSLPFS